MIQFYLLTKTNTNSTIAADSADFASDSVTRYIVRNTEKKQNTTILNRLNAWHDSRYANECCIVFMIEIVD